jgi:cytochrome d ubiquinol oxidase subunit II
MIGVVSLWTPFLNPRFLDRWSGWPGIVLTSPVPIRVLALAVVFWRALARGSHITPFLCVLGWLTLCFGGLGICVFPLMVPPDISIWDAAAPHASQTFLLVGASVLVPTPLIYAGFS